MPEKDDFLRGKLTQKLNEAERLIREVQVNRHVTDQFSDSCITAIDATHDLYETVLFEDKWEEKE